MPELEMSADPNKKSPRTFQCRDALWDKFEQMARELECSVDYLINDAMKQYAKQRNYVSSGTGTHDSMAATHDRYGSAPPQGPGPGYRAGSVPPPVQGSGRLPPPVAPNGGGYGARGGGLPVPPPSRGAAPPPSTRGGLPMPSAPGRSYPPPPPAAGRLGGSTRSEFGAPPPPARGGDPRGGDMRGSDMRGGDPRGGDMRGGDMRGGDMRGGDMRGGDMRGGDMRGGDMRGGDMRGAPPPPAGGGYGREREPSGNGYVNPAASLTVIYNGERVAVAKDRFVIGRGKQSSDLTLKDPNVSRQHAMIEFQNGAYFMVDMGSTNGVEYNGQRIARKQIAEGDVYRICDHDLRFTFR